MKYVPAAANLDRKLFDYLLWPSWLSASICLLAGLVVGLGTVLFTHFQTSSFRLQLLNAQVSAPTRYQTLTSHILSNSFISNLPLLLFWTLVGLIVYLFVANIFAGIRNTADLKDELNYVNADRHELIMNALKHLLIRLLVLVVWIIYIFIFFNHIVPYCVAAALAGSGQLGGLQDGLYILISIVLMALAVHVHVILLRLLLLRPRVFSSAVYVD